MVPPSRVGALGRGRRTDLAAPAPIAHLELAAVWRPELGIEPSVKHLARHLRVRSAIGS
jgi:hypothetical protein